METFDTYRGVAMQGARAIEYVILDFPGRYKLLVVRYSVGISVSH